MSNNYSIKDLEHLSGIKAHTIRIWEQRYRLFNPQRTDTNIRYYTDRDLKLLLNVSLLKDHGFKISKIADMPYEAIVKEVADLSDRFGDDEQIAALTIAMIDMDEVKFEKIMANNILKRGFENTIIKVIYPFLHRIGVLWMTGSIVPAQEHFISNLIRQKIVTAIDGQFGNIDPKVGKFILFLPPGELHEISLLFADYMIRSHGGRSVYLGQSVPLDDMVPVCEIHQPDYIFTIATSAMPQEDIQMMLDGLSQIAPETTVLVTGYQILNADFNLPSNVRIVKDFGDLKTYLV